MYRNLWYFSPKNIDKVGICFTDHVIICKLRKQILPHNHTLNENISIPDLGSVTKINKIVERFLTSKKSGVLLIFPLIFTDVLL